MIKIGVQKRKNLSRGPANFFQRLIDAINENEYAKIVGTKNVLQDILLVNSVANRINFKQHVVRIDGIYFDKNEQSGKNETLNKRIFKTIETAKGVIFQSNFSKNLVEAHYGDINIPKVTIINGAPLRVVKPRKNKKKIIVCSANWRAHKRLSSIISVVRGLRSELDCELLVLGDVGSFNKVTHDFVTFIGKVDKASVFQYLERADLFLHLAWLDPCPNSVVEAISCGVPVVCSNQGGTPEIVNKTGCGRVAMCDVKVDYGNLVDLYNPPLPDIDEIIRESIYVLNNFELILSKMDRSTI
ncbi:glycosyltransferase family 4 protein, partial [Amylibacter sp.]|nr:glycosyltransferase family 4 protein [Amylibacter sp.]